MPVSTLRRHWLVSLVGPSIVVRACLDMACAVLFCNARYTTACDVWAMGVMMYMILSGEPPFNGANEKEILRSAQAGKFVFDEYVLFPCRPRVKSVCDLFCSSSCCVVSVALLPYQPVRSGTLC